MKILIVSDTHRHHENLDLAMEQCGQIDMLLHMGDVEGGEHYIEAVTDCPVHIVAGNNDFFSMLKKEEEFNIGKYHIFMTHGHYYYVSMGTERIKEEGKARHADIVMFGHTHKPVLEEEDGMIILNPGSLSYPRQNGKRPSYILMEIDKNGDAHFDIKYL